MLLVYLFEGLLLGTAPNRPFRPTDYALGTLPKTSPYAVSGTDNNILELMVSVKSWRGCERLILQRRLRPDIALFGAFSRCAMPPPGP